MKYAFIRGSEVAFPVAIMCRVLGVSRSGFYDWKAQPTSSRSRRSDALRSKVRTVFLASKSRYGSPRVRAELRAGGEAVSGKTVAKLMRQEKLVARAKKRFHATTDSKHDNPIAANIVERVIAWITSSNCMATFTHS